MLYVLSLLVAFALGFVACCLLDKVPSNQIDHDLSHPDGDY
jgi:hypothetical protein